MSFSEKEVRDEIFQMKHNKALGPNGFPVEFYQSFWEIIKDDLMALFKEFYNGTLNLYILNFGIITLLPKQKEVTHIKQFCPICLLNMSFKIFTKVAVKKIIEITEDLINPSQTTFTIHELRRKKMNRVILKIDFENAYDKVKWSFLQQTLMVKGFSEKWCSWINEGTIVFLPLPRTSIITYPTFFTFVILPLGFWILKRRCHLPLVLDTVNLI
jgi:hypothetical protein